MVFDAAFEPKAKASLAGKQSRGLSWRILWTRPANLLPALLALVPLHRHNIDLNRAFSQRIKTPGLHPQNPLAPLKSEEAACILAGSEAGLESEIKAGISKLAISVPAKLKLEKLVPKLLANVRPLFQFTKTFPAAGRRENLLSVDGKLVYLGSNDDAVTAFQIADPQYAVFLDVQGFEVADRIRVNLIIMGAANLRVDRSVDRVVFSFDYRGKINRQITFFPNIDIKDQSAIPAEALGAEVVLDLGCCEFFFGTPGHNKILAAAQPGASVVTDTTLRDYNRKEFSFSSRQDPNIRRPLKYQGTIFGQRDYGWRFTHLLVFQA